MGAAASGSTRWGVLALVAAFLMAGCASTAPTPLTVYLTLPPGETPSATATAEATPSPTEEPSPSESPAESPSESPSASPASPAAGCTGSEAHKAYFVNAAKDLPWDVYCAVLPSGWWLQSSEYKRADGGRMNVAYTNSAGDDVTMIEGRLCYDDLPICGDIYPVLGSASYGGLAGTMRDMGGGGRCVAVNPHSVPGYNLCSRSLSQAKVAQFAAAVIKVPKP
jgi:hypothetical protein